MDIAVCGAGTAAGAVTAAVDGDAMGMNGD